MGHSTATRTYSAEAFDRITGGGRDLRAIVTTAVREWYDEEADRHDDARDGWPQLTPIVSPALAWRSSENVVRSGDYTAVVPIAADSDVVSKTQRVKIAVEPAMLRSLAAKLEQNPGGVGVYEHDIPGLAEQYPNAVAFKVVAVPRLPKPRAVATEGSAETVYQVHGVDRFGRPTVVATGATQAEARAKALEIAEADSRQTRLTVRAAVMRAKTTAKSTAGSFAAKQHSAPTSSLQMPAEPLGPLELPEPDHSPDLVVIERPVPEKAEIAVEVTTETVKPNAKPAQYAIAFDYHH